MVDVVVVDVEGRDRAVSASHPYRLPYEYFTLISPTNIFAPLLISVPSWTSSISVKILFDQLTRMFMTSTMSPILHSIVQWRSRNYLLIADMHVAPTVYFPVVTWSKIDSIFVDHGQNLWTKYVVYMSPVTSIGASTVGAICSILADSTMVRLTPLGYFTTAYKV